MKNILNLGSAPNQQVFSSPMAAQAYKDAAAARAQSAKAIADMFANMFKGLKGGKGSGGKGGSKGGGAKPKAGPKPKKPKLLGIEKLKNEMRAAGLEEGGEKWNRAISNYTDKLAGIKPPPMSAREKHDARMVSLGLDPKSPEAERSWQFTLNKELYGMTPTQQRKAEQESHGGGGDVTIGGRRYGSIDEFLAAQERGSDLGGGDLGGADLGGALPPYGDIFNPSSASPGSMQASPAVASAGDIASALGEARGPVLSMPTKTSLEEVVGVNGMPESPARRDYESFMALPDESPFKVAQGMRAKLPEYLSDDQRKVIQDRISKSLEGLAGLEDIAKSFDESFFGAGARARISIDPAVRGVQDALSGVVPEGLGDSLTTKSLSPEKRDRLARFKTATSEEKVTRLKELLGTAQTESELKNAKPAVLMFDPFDPLGGFSQSGEDFALQAANQIERARFALARQMYQAEKGQLDPAGMVDSATNRAVLRQFFVEKNARAMQENARQNGLTMDDGAALELANKRATEWFNADDMRAEMGIPTKTSMEEDSRGPRKEPAAWNQRGDDVANALLMANQSLREPRRFESMEAANRYAEARAGTGDLVDALSKGMPSEDLGARPDGRPIVSQEAANAEIEEIRQEIARIQSMAEEEQMSEREPSAMEENNPRPLTALADRFRAANGLESEAGDGIEEYLQQIGGEILNDVRESNPDADDDAIYALAKTEMDKFLSTPEEEAPEPEPLEDEEEEEDEGMGAYY